MPHMYAHCMQNSTPLSYAAELVRALRRDRFLLCLFVPMPQREYFFTLYAFDAELLHVHGAVTEELNGHIRYAWWQEALDGIAQNKTPRAHPVIEALSAMMKQGLLSHAELSDMVTRYRSIFPEKPQGLEKVDAIAARLVATLCPQAEAGWGRAREIITRHREKHGQRLNPWLTLKLMRLGVA